MAYAVMPSDREFSAFLANYSVKSRQVAVLAERRTPPRLTLDQQQLLHFYRQHERRTAVAAATRAELDPSTADPATRRERASDVTERMIAAGTRIYDDMNQRITTERTAA